MRRAVLLSVVLLIAAASQPPALGMRREGNQERADLRHYFEEAGTEGTMVVRTVADGGRETVAVGSARSKRRYLPSSTFKIPNSLIAIESGVATGAEHVFPGPRDPLLVDGEPLLPEICNGDITLRLAYRNSCVPVYQEIARRVGRKTYERVLRRLRYGNQRIGPGPVDSFWLDGELRISAREQITFLERLFNDRVPFSARAVAEVKDVMLVEETDDHVIRGKTGYVFTTRPRIGWWVGWVERHESTTFFALNLDVTAPEHLAARSSIARAILQKLGVL